MTFYNDTEPYVAEWLRNLSITGEISAGDVSTEPIQEIEGWELTDYTRCHFFAGIGGWDYALQLAGWPQDLPVWTGSCPCQPFSVAGKRKGINDERHLWPYFRNLIDECKPSIIFGEQVASKDGRLWLAGVRADLEALGYVVGAADLCAAGVGAPHIRQRLYWLAYTQCNTRDARRLADKPGESIGAAATGARAELGRRSVLSRLAYSLPAGRPEGRAESRNRSLTGSGSPDRLADTFSLYEQQQREEAKRETELTGRSGASRLGDSNNKRSQGRSFDIGEYTDKRSAWSSSEFISCLDGKARRVEPGVFPLAHGVSARMGKLRAYGNAIVPQVAAEFIKSAMDILFV